MIIGKYNKSVIVTYLGVLSTAIGIFFILGNESPLLTLPIICFMISGICDLFDGRIARMCKGRTEEDKEFGIQIDSLTDMISFIAYPMIILYGYSKGLNVGLNPWITIPIMACFIIAGISRLAYFNVQAALEDGPVKYYTGLPVTSTSIIFPTFYLLRYVVDAQVFVGINLALFAVIAFLMVFKFKLPKPKANWWYITCSVLAAVMAAILIYIRFYK